MPRLRQTPGPSPRHRAPALRVLALAVAPLLVSCELAYTEVAVVNLIDEDVLISQVSFNGCKWEESIAFGEATSPGRCLPGTDSVHFKKLDGHSYCSEQVEDGSIDELCYCDPEDAPPDDEPVDPGLINQQPMWFSYKTISVKEVSWGSFQVFYLRADDIEQDFEVPGPYGH